MDQTVVKKLEVKNRYFIVSEALLMASLVVNVETGCSLEVSLVDKLIYSYMYHHSCWFNSMGKSLSESQDTIGNAFALDRKTVGRSIKKLEDVGLVCRKKQKGENGIYTIYTIPDVFCGNFRLFFDQVIRVKGQADSIEQVEIIQETVAKREEYLTASQLPTKKVEQYDYANDDLVLPF